MSTRAANGGNDIEASVVGHGKLHAVAMATYAARAENKRMRGAKQEGRVLGLSRRASRASWHACERVRGHAATVSCARLATHAAIPIQKLKN